MPLRNGFHPVSNERLLFRETTGENQQVSVEFSFNIFALKRQNVRAGVAVQKLTRIRNNENVYGVKRKPYVLIAMHILLQQIGNVWESTD